MKIVTITLTFLFQCLQYSEGKLLIIFPENEKDDKSNSTNDEAKKDGGANP